MNSRVKLNLELYQKIYLIRRAEEVIVENYSSDEMKTPMHMSMGEEAIVAGVCQALREGDQVFGTYRSHGLYLAKTGETDKFFAEMYGKESGVVKGKGGSMHLSSPEAGFLATSAVVASTIPVAVGAAYANRLRGNKKTVAAFFGDGAVDEGVFWESLNLACLFRLPMLFICEDNDLAVHMAGSRRHGYNSIEKIVAQFNCFTLSSQTTDSEEIYKLTKEAIHRSLKFSKPLFLHFKYYRYLEHVGVNEDFDKGYRTYAEFGKWLKKDPVKVTRSKLLSLRLTESALERVEKKIEQQINLSLKKAKEAGFAGKSELFKDVYYEKN